MVRAQEFQRMGVPHLWILDPETREAWTIDAAGGAMPMTEKAFVLPETPVRVELAEVFEEIDSAPKA